MKSDYQIIIKYINYQKNYQKNNIISIIRKVIIQIKKLQQNQNFKADLTKTL